LGRSLSHLIRTTTGLEERSVGFKSLQEGIDTTTSGGKLVFHIFGALAEFERSLIRERTNAGLKAARARGRNGGRPKLLDARKLAVAESLLRDPKLTVAEVAEQVGIARSTLYTYLDVMNSKTRERESRVSLERLLTRYKQRLDPRTQTPTTSTGRWPSGSWAAPAPWERWCIMSTVTPGTTTPRTSGSSAANGRT
jgi:AraC-like DNA-binding protein